MPANIGDMKAPPTQTKSWCVQWLGSEGDVLAGAKRQPIPLERLNGLENLYAIGSLDERPGEVSIFDSVPFISEVWHSAETIDSNSIYRAEFLIYAIVECWHRNSIWQTVEGKKNWQPRYCHEPWQRESMSTNLFHFYFPAMLLGQPVAFSVPRVIRMAGNSAKKRSRAFPSKRSPSK